jgi:hypothetical protein
MARQLLDCASPLALLKKARYGKDDEDISSPFQWRKESGRGQPQSKTSWNFDPCWFIRGYSFLESL